MVGSIQDLSFRSFEHQNPDESYSLTQAGTVAREDLLYRRSSYIKIGLLLLAASCAAFSLMASAHFFGHANFLRAPSAWSKILFKAGFAVGVTTFLFSILLLTHASFLNTKYFQPFTAEQLGKYVISRSEL